MVGPGQRPNATLAPIPQDTPHPTVHSLLYGDRDDSAELESTCTRRINPFSTAIYHCNAIRHSFLTATPYTRPPDTNDNQSQHENRHDHTIHATAASITLDRHDSGIASITLSEQDPRLPSVDPAHLTYFTLDERESRSANVIPGDLACSTLDERESRRGARTAPHNPDACKFHWDRTIEALDTMGLGLLG